MSETPKYPDARPEMQEQFKEKWKALHRKPAPVIAEPIERVIARRLAVETAPQVLSCVDYVDKLERTLRDIGVGELIAAGKKCADRLDFDAALPGDIQARELWDAALAKVRRAGG